MGGIVFIGGSLATAAATVGVFIAAAPSGPLTAAKAAGAAAKGGMLATTVATIYATGAPTP